MFAIVHLIARLNLFNKETNASTSSQLKSATMITAKAIFPQEYIPQMIW